MKKVLLAGKDILLLAAPHTWSASVIPALFALVYSYRYRGGIDILMAILGIAICVLMQSSVNTLNDYADFVKGTDKVENSPDAYDAVLVHGGDSKTALISGIIHLAVAAALGIFVISQTGLIPLYIGAAGGIVVLLYSFGKTPISYLPLGEIVSGITMGGLIPLAVSYMQLRILNWEVMFYSMPISLGIALIMFSNNGCDISRDIEAGRKTVPVLMGQRKTQMVYRILLVSWPFFALSLLSRQAIPVYVAAFLLAVPCFVRQLRLPLGENVRSQIMSGIVQLNSLIGLAYMLAVAVGGLYV